MKYIDVYRAIKIIALPYFPVVLAITERVRTMTEIG